MTNGDFQIKEKETNGDRLTVEVEVSAPVVKKAFRKVYRSLLNYVAVPGFRKGKAPMDVIANRVGVERFNEEVVSELLPKYYYKSVENEERRPVSDVEYIEQNLAKGSPFTFKAAVDIAPEIELGDYNELDIPTIPLEEITDEDIDKQIEGLRRRMAKMSEPEEGSKISEGHMIHLRYSGKVDGNEYKSLSNVTAMVAGEEDFLPGFSENLIGMDKGEEKVFNVKVADDYELKHLAGKDIEFTVKVFSFQNMELPEVNDELAAKAGPFKTVDDLKGKIREELEKQKTKEQQDKFFKELREKLAEIVTCELSEERINAAVELRYEEIEGRLKSNNVTVEEHLKETNQSEEEFRKEIADAEIFDMKVDYALDKIAIAEGVEVSDKEVDSRIAMTAYMYKREAADIRHALDSTGSVVLRKFDLYREKAFNLLQERYRIKAGLDTEEKDKD